MAVVVVVVVGALVVRSAIYRFHGLRLSEWVDIKLLEASDWWNVLNGHINSAHGLVMGSWIGSRGRYCTPFDNHGGGESDRFFETSRINQELCFSNEGWHLQHLPGYSNGQIEHARQAWTNTKRERQQGRLTKP